MLFRKKSRGLELRGDPRKSELTAFTRALQDRFPGWDHDPGIGFRRRNEIAEQLLCLLPKSGAACNIAMFVSVWTSNRSLQIDVRLMRGKHSRVPLAEARWNIASIVGEVRREFGYTMEDPFDVAMLERITRDAQPGGAHHLLARAAVLAFVGDVQLAKLRCGEALAKLERSSQPPTEWMIECRTDCERLLGMIDRGEGASFLDRRI